MPRFVGGRRGRRRVPGVQDALEAYFWGLDTAFCALPAGAEVCGLCETMRRLRAGSCVLAGATIYRGLAGHVLDMKPYADLRGSSDAYQVIGPDLIELAG